MAKRKSMSFAENLVGRYRPEDLPRSIHILARFIEDDGKTRMCPDPDPSDKAARSAHRRLVREYLIVKAARVPIGSGVNIYKLTASGEAKAREAKITVDTYRRDTRAWDADATRIFLEKRAEKRAESNTVTNGPGM